MVVALLQYNIRPDKAAEYVAYAQANVHGLLSAPGIVEIQTYRNITGRNQITSLYVFDNLADYATWRSNDAVNKIAAETWQYIEDVHIELLGPSPFAAEPLRPQPK